jgi:hypothetical protein
MKDVFLKGIVLAFFLLIALISFPYLLKLDQKILLCYLIAILSFAFCVFSILTTTHGLELANENIFKGSVDPKSMAYYLYQSFFLQSKTFITVLIITIISILLVIEVLKPSEGLPVITGAVGFLLGKEFTATNKGIEKKNKQD